MYQIITEYFETVFIIIKFITKMFYLFKKLLLLRIIIIYKNVRRSLKFC